MHPLEERRCDELLNHPLLRTPPPEPVVPKPPKIRKPRTWICPPRFPLVPKNFYMQWCNHRKDVHYMKHIVDCHPPELFPDLYLKPRTLNTYAKQLEGIMNQNKHLLKRINTLQRKGGYVDCWNKVSGDKNYVLRCEQRQRELNTIRKENISIYKRLLTAKSEQWTTKQLNTLWRDTKHKLILGATLPFILFKTDHIDRDMKDPAFDKPPSLYRPKVIMDIKLGNGANVGKLTIELFTDIAPKTCHLFLALVKGDPQGRAYTGTRFFRIVPGLYCRGGDTLTDLGFSTYVPVDQEDPMKPENFVLNHSIPGVVSMAISENAVTGQFNIIFKPLPQLDGKNTVIGRVVGGPPQALELISELGQPLGTTTYDCMIHKCGWITRSGHYRNGAPNTVKFPPRSKSKK